MVRNPMLLGLFLSVAILSGDATITRVAGRHENALKAKPSGPLGERYRGGNFSGVVAEITGTTISVQQPGNPAFRFKLSPALAAGELPKFVPEPGPIPAPWTDSYLNMTCDLRVGDHIEVIFSRWDQCDAFMIYRRPGGRVPPVRGEAEPKEDWVLRHHERMNYLQDLEEKGIPLPERYYGPSGSGRVAPLPREVVPPISSAAP